MSATLITGAAGFIGSALTHALLDAGQQVIALDALTYAGNRASLPDHAALRFVEGDIRDRALLDQLIRDHEVERLYHLAAESHVDRSLDGPLAFIETNVTGTATVLEAVRAAPHTVRMLHISTDEVFGTAPPGTRFTEDTPYDPSSPYAASKAASDHLVRAWSRSYGLEVMISNCSNNYGPRQFPEKLIPLVILNARAGRPLPVYGSGTQVRDWLHVDDHAAALIRIMEDGQPGRTYAVGGQAERRNIEVVHAICAALDARLPDAAPHADLIAHVPDRPGHDIRYAIDPSRAAAELGWTPRHSFEAGIAATVDWYLSNEAWWRPLRARYDGQRLGAG